MHVAGLERIYSANVEVCHLGKIIHMTTAADPE